MAEDQDRSKSDRRDHQRRIEDRRHGSRRSKEWTSTLRFDRSKGWEFANEDGEDKTGEDS